MPNPDTSNVSSFFYTDDSYGRDDFVRKSNLASIQAGEVAPTLSVTRRPSGGDLGAAAQQSHSSAQQSQSSDGSLGSAADAITAVHDISSAKRKYKKKSKAAAGTDMAMPGTLDDPLLLQEEVPNPLVQQEEQKK
jgi:hypothetical protein